MATYAVGDIQGCLSHLEQLLEHVGFNEKEDSLWCAGDLINRGPQSLDTLRFIKSLKNTHIVLGNHDLHLLACRHSDRQPGRKDTFQEILDAPDADELLDWLICQPLLHVDKQLGYAMVHAGIPPQWKLKTAHAHAKEVEAVLRSENSGAFFAEMYGNKPDIWSDSLSGMARLRVITNYLTRMRFCDKHGRLDFDAKGTPTSPPKGFLPWYSIPNHACHNKNILFGHWAAMMGETGKSNFIGLDTGCVWKGYLTMIHLETGDFYCQDCSL